MPEKMSRAVDTAVTNNQSLRESARPLGLSGPERSEFIKDPEIESAAIDITSAPAVADLLANPDMFSRLNALSAGEVSTLVSNSESSNAISTDPFEAYVQRNLASTVDSKGNAIGVLGKSAERTVKSIADMPGLDFDTVAGQLHDKFTATEVLDRANKVNDKVNRAMQMVINNTELFATPYADMDSGQRKKVESLINNAGLTPNQVNDMHRAAVRLESGSDTIRKMSGKVAELDQSIKDAERRKDTSLVAELNRQKSSLEERMSNLDDRHLNVLRERLTASEIALLSHDADQIPLNHNQLAELGDNNSNSNWDPNDPNAQQAAKNMFDFMSNPYGGTEDDTKNGESGQNQRGVMRRRMGVVLGAGGLLVGAAVGLYIGNKTGVQINSPRALTEQLQAGGDGFSFLGRVSARVENALRSMTGAGTEWSPSEALKSLNPFSNGGNSYAREIFENTTDSAKHSWGEGLKALTDYAARHPRSWRVDIDAAALTERVKSGKYAAVQLGKMAAKSIGHRALR